MRFRSVYRRLFVFFRVALFTLLAGLASGLLAGSLTARTVQGAAASAAIGASAPFTFRAPQEGLPVLTSIVPDLGSQSAAVPVTLTGTNFAGGGFHIRAGSLITVYPIVVISSTSAIATFSIGRDAIPGLRTIQVVTNAGSSETVGFTVRPPVPTLTGVLPSVGVRGTPTPVTLTGANFIGGGLLVNASGTGVTVDTVVVASGTSATAILNIAPDAIPGIRTVTATTSGGSSAAVSFSVVPVTPTLTSVSPASGQRGMPVPVTLTGTNFVSGGVAVNAGPGISASPAIVSDTTVATTTLTIAVGAAEGARSIAVVTTGGSSNVLTFNVQPPPLPTLTGIAPVAGSQAATLPVTLTGTNFQAGILALNAGPGIGVSGPPVIDGNGVQAVFTLVIGPTAVTGPRGISVTTAGGTSSGPVEFTVLPRQPILASVAPNAGIQGVSIPVTLTGAHFDTGGFAIDTGTPSVTVSSIVVLSSTSATATFAVSPALEPAATRAISVTTAGGSSGAVNFSVKPPQPVLSAVTPVSGRRGSTVPVTLTGTGFVPNAGDLTIGIGSGVTASAIAVLPDSTTTATANLTLALGAAEGGRELSVVTSGGTSNALTFRIDPLLPPTLTGAVSGFQSYTAPVGVLTPMSPPSGARGRTGTPSNVPVTILGTNFTPGSRVVVDGGAPGISSSLTLVTNTELRGTLSISVAVTEGIKDLVVTTEAGTSASVPFTVKPPLPTITGITPANGGQGSDVVVTLIGANFDNNRDVGLTLVLRTGLGMTFTGTAETAATSSFINGVQNPDAPVQIIENSGGTRATAKFTIAPGAGLGTHILRAATESGMPNSNNAVEFAIFTVQTPVPTLTRVSPSAGAQGDTVAVTLNGSNFLTGGFDLVSLSSGVTVVPGSVAVQTANTATVTLSVNPAAMLGAHSLSVQTAAGQSGTLPFNVLRPNPTLTSIIPSSGGQGMAVPVTLQGTNFISGMGGAGLSIQPGTGITAGALVVSAGGTQATTTFTILPTTAAPAAGAPTGDRSILVATGSGTSNAIAFTVEPAQLPVLTGVSPAAGGNGAFVAVTLQGSNFIPGLAVSPVPGITASTPTVNAARTTATVTLTIGSSAVLGDRAITVQTLAGTSNSVPFRVLAVPAPTLVIFSPSQGPQGATAFPVSVIGSNLNAGSFTLNDAGTGITINSIDSVIGTTASVTIDIAADAALGPHPLTVSTVSGTSGTRNFTVLPPTPTLTGLTPATGSQGATVPVTLTGTNFYSGLAVQSSGFSVTGSSVVVLSSTTATANLVIGSTAALGVRNIGVATPSGTSGAISFTVQAPQTPVLTGLTPATGRQGQSIPITVSGSNFITGLQIRPSLVGISTSDPLMTLSALTFSGTQATATLAIGIGASIADRDIVAVTQGGVSNIMAFTVLPPDPPTLTAIKPDAAPPNTSVTVTFTGSNLSPGGFAIDPGPGISVSSFTANGASATAVLAIGSAAAVGPRAIAVSTAGGTSANVIFTVLPPMPVLTGITPNLGVAGTPLLPVTLTGANFDVGGVSLNMASSTMTVSSLDVLSGTRATANLAIGAATTPTTHRAFLQTPFGTSGTVDFSVLPPAPVLTSISPNTALQGGATVPVTLSGSNFAAGAGFTTIEIAGTGLAAGSVQVIGGTSATAIFMVSPAALPGGRNVRISTSGGSSEAVIFTIGPAAAPTLTGITPAFGNRESAVTVTLSGANFMQGLAIDAGFGIAVSAVNFIGGQATATLLIGSGAAFGVRDLTVSTAGGGSNAIPFTVLEPLPVLTSVHPADGAPGGTITVTLSGRLFASGMTVAAGTGITVTDVALSGSTAATATFAIASNAGAGYRNVTVTTADGTSKRITFGVAATTGAAFGGPPGGMIRALVVDPSSPARVYAAANAAGVFKSSDGGLTWTQISSGLTNMSIRSLAIDPSTPSTLYAGTLNGGLFKSTNGGTTWTASTLIFGPQNLGVQSLAIDPSTPAIVYAGTNGGVYKSSNSGSTWTAVNSGLGAVSVSGLGIDPSTPSTLYAGTGSGVFKSSNSGNTWVLTNAGLSIPSVVLLAIDPSVPANVYVGTSGGGIFRSSDSGASWTAANSGLTEGNVHSLATDPSTPFTLYAGTFRSGVFKSTNGGISWTALNSGLTNPYVTALAVAPSDPSTVFAGTNGGGVFRSSNGGADWAGVNTGMRNAPVQSLVIDPAAPSTVYAGTDGGGILISTNGGMSWTGANTGLTSVFVYALAMDPSSTSILYAGTDGSGVFKSTNGGLSWTAVNTGLVNPYISSLVIDPSAPSTLYAGTMNGVFKSANGGASWNAVNSGLTDTQINTLAIDPTTPSTLYTGTWGGVFKSTNGGLSWTAMNSGLSNMTVTALAIDPTTPSTLYAGTYGPFFKSSNGGASWQGLIFGTPGIQTVVLDAFASTTIYAGGSGAGILKSINGGTSWTTLNSGLANINVRTLAVDPSAPATLYAGTFGGGVFRSSNGAANWQPTGANFGNGAEPATAISRISGAGQVAIVNQRARYPLVAVATNADGIPVAGVTVNFAVIAGGGAIFPTEAVTDASGVAGTQWTMGPLPGPNAVTAMAVGISGTGLTYAAMAVPLASPMVTGILPSTGFPGSRVNVTLTGTNFVAGLTLNAGANITVTGVTVLSGTSVAASLDIGLAATLGVRGVSVNTSAGSSGAVPFTVAPLIPVLTALSPDSIPRGDTVLVTLTGTNFISGLTVTAGDNVAISNVDVTSSSSATALFAVDASANTGARNVTVTTAGGVSTPAALTVTAPDLSPGSVHTTSFGVGFNESYSVTVANVGTAASRGAYTITDTLPTGLTLVSASGAGWSCSSGSPLTCSNANTIGLGQSSSVLTIVVSVDATAVPSVTHTVSVLGGGDPPTSNNTASDPTAVVATPVPAFVFTPTTLIAGEPAILGVTIASPFPHDVTGSVAVSFISNAAIPLDDPAIQFATGTRQAVFMIPANTLDARFGPNLENLTMDSVGFQTGTVSGTLSFSGVLTAGTVQSSFSPSMDLGSLAIPRLPPSIQAIGSVAGPDSTVVAQIALSSTMREVTSVTLQFNTTSPVQLTCGGFSGCTASGSRITLNVKALFDAWFGSDVTFGGLSVLRLPMSISGIVQGSISVTLQNSEGVSNAMTFPLP